MGKDANKIKRDILAIAATHPRIGRLESSPSGTFRLHHGGYFRGLPKGWPDLTGHLVDGRALYVEIKTENDTLTDAQDEFLANARARGCVAGVVGSAAEFVALVEGE